MADTEIQQQQSMGLPRSVGASSLNDTFDLQQALKDLEDQVARDGSSAPVSTVSCKKYFKFQMHSNLTRRYSIILRTVLWNNLY